MARKLRVEFPGACYHVINRGNDRRRIFGTEGRAFSFEKVLLEACEQYGWRLHAYVIMGNHYHLALETPEPNLGLGMKWMQATWARRANLYHGVSGRPFQGRYKALLVEPGHVLAQVCHYIHLNPVRAKLVEPGEAASYRWSSLHRWMTGDVPKPLTAETFLREAGNLADSPAGWRKYGEYLDWLGRDETVQRQRAFDRMSEGWCVGSEDFRKSMQQALLERSTGENGPISIGTSTARELQDLREAQWEEALRREAGKRKIRLDDLPEKKSAPEKVRLAAALRATTSASNSWIAERLSMGKPATVSQYVRRFRQEQEENPNH